VEGYRTWIFVDFYEAVFGALSHGGDSKGCEGVFCGEGAIGFFVGVVRFLRFRRRGEEGCVGP
jgi:hypothetical protein